MSLGGKENGVRNSVLVIALFITLVSECLAVNEISKKQPISAGDSICMSSLSANRGYGKIFYFYEYTFLGTDNNKIKIEVVKKMASEADPFPKITDQRSLELLLNSKKQALLEVESLEESNLNATKEILLSVADEFGRIRAEIYQK